LLILSRECFCFGHYNDVQNFRSVTEHVARVVATEAEGVEAAAETIKQTRTIQQTADQTTKATDRVRQFSHDVSCAASATNILTNIPLNRS